MRPHGWRHHRRGRPPLGVRLVAGIHGRLFAFLLVAAALGTVAGVALHASLGGGWGGLCVALAVLAALWPLGWMAAFRIAWPLRELARVGTELRAGQLSSRAELPEGPDEVGEVADALRGMADRVATQLADQRALLAAVSHELRSPLGRARVLVELARDGGAVHDDLQSEIDAMDRLVGDLLAAARIDFEAVVLSDLDAGEVARRAVEIAGRPDTRLVTDGARVRADATLLTRALSVVIDNAWRYGAREVTVRVVPTASDVRFEVEDDGPGLPDTDAVFEPFWRGPHGASPPAGAGLGLALVRQIARAHQGEARAENRPGAGARVWIRVPRAV